MSEPNVQNHQSQSTQQEHWQKLKEKEIAEQGEDYYKRNYECEFIGQ